MAFIDIDEEEFRKELDEATQEHRAGVAREALDVAVKLAETIADRGTLRDTLEVGGGDGSLLGTSDPVGHIKEWGSVDTPPHAVLRKAAETVGCDIEDGGPR